MRLQGLWPTNADREPREARYWVPSSDGGIVQVEVAPETPTQVEIRLQDDFPLYRAAAAAGFVTVQGESRG